MFERSGYAAGYYPSVDPKGDDRLLIVVKRTFKLDAVEAKCVPLDKIEPIRLADEYVGDEDPFKSSIAIESDLAPYKLAKDIVFVGKSYAPGGKKAKSWDASLRVGPHVKKLRVFGPRTVSWVPPRESKKKDVPPEPQPPVIGEPEPIAEVDVTFENAYGGFATFYPPDPSLFRKAVRKAKKQAQKKEAQKKAAEDKKAAEAKDKADTAKKAAAKQKQDDADKSWFMGGGKKLEDAPDVPLEVEIGSRRLKTRDGAIVLELAEIAEADERDASSVTLDRSDRDAAVQKRLAREDGAEVIDEEALRKLAADDTAAAEAARKAQALAARLADDAGTKLIDLADLGEAVESDADWVDVEKKRRDELYESLGLDPNEEVVWEEGEFPRIPCLTNFVGQGFALGNSKEALDGLKMPLIEDPDRLIAPEQLPVDAATMHLGGLIEPAGLSVVHRGWSPRSMYNGFFPKELEAQQLIMDKQLAELDPDDPDDEIALRSLIERKPQPLDPRVHNGAAFQVKTLWGDEDVFLENLDKSGKTYFKLPGRRPYVRLERGKGWEKIEVELDTLVIDREAEKVELVWRGRVPYGGPKELETYPRVDIDVQDFSVVEWRDSLEREAIARRKKRGEALVLGVDEISAEESALFDKRIEQAGIGLHGVKETIHHDREEQAEDGALYDLQDQPDVVQSDGDWVEKAKLDLMTEEERRAYELAQDEKKAVAAKKEALKARLAAIDEKKRLEAEEAAKAAKKKKPKKEQDKPPSGDDDEDDAGDEPPGGETPKGA